MFAGERRKHIEQYILGRGSVSVQELKDLYGVSEVTIRKDLDELSGNGLIFRTHGGAMIKYQSRQDLRLSDLTILYPEEKKAIARKALEFIENGDSIILDMSTTVLELAVLLNESNLENITVITSSVKVSEILIKDSIDVILLGGNVNKRMASVFGPLTEAQLRLLNVDKCFIGVNGVDTEYGISVGDFNEAALKNAMRQSSKRFFVLADHSKFQKKYMARVMSIGEISNIITDRVPGIDYSPYESRTKIVFA